MKDRAVKSVDAKDAYTDYLDRIKIAINNSIKNGDSVAAIAARIGANRDVIYQLRKGSYASVMNTVLLFAFDSEFDLGIFN